jgi:hypothetical protein
MALTFEVFPAADVPPSPESLAAAATAHLRRFLGEAPVDRLVDLSEGLAARIRARLASRAQEVEVRARPLGGSAMGLAVHPGGGALTLQRVPWRERPICDGRDSDLPTAELVEHLGLTRALGYSWVLSRELGEPPLSCLAHGMAAAALAEGAGAGAGAAPPMAGAVSPALPQA